MNQDYYLCRLCARKRDDVIDIFAENNVALNISTKITKCLHINEDALPKTVCNECHSKLNNSFEFLELSSRAQITLLENFQHKNDEDLKDGTSKAKLRSKLRKKLQPPTKTFTSTNKRKLIKTSPPEQLKSDSSEIDDSMHISESDEETPSTKSMKEKDCNERIRLDKIYSWQCTDCTEILETPQCLKEHHRNVHCQTVRYQCIECAKVYTVYRKFSRHVRLHRNRDKFKCSECGKAFATKQSLESHAIFHSTERPHVCGECGKTFRQRGSLYVHRRLHQTDIEHFPCPKCDRRLLSRHALDSHVKTHSGSREFTCEMCGRGFSVKQGLVYHMLSHSGDRPHPCQVCGMRCKTVYLLKKHMTTHSDEKKHQCDVCGKQFRERGTLAQHSRIHTGAMPYACEVCAKTFRFQGALTIHRRQHTGERPYRCSECGRDFTNWANYNKHMKRRHSLTVKKNYADPTFYTDNPCKTTPVADFKSKVPSVKAPLSDVSRTDPSASTSDPSSVAYEALTYVPSANYSVPMYYVQPQPIPNTQVEALTFTTRITNQ